MKTTIKYILFLMLLTNCKAQNNSKNTVKMKTFDIETFNKKSDGREIIFITKDSTVISQRKDQFDYYETVKPKNSYFQTINTYYLNGKLKSTVQDFPNDFLAGVMKEYDEQGNLIKETDYDAPYKFTWEDILAFIKKRKIDMGTLQFQINRGFDYGNFDESKKDKPFWAITYEDGSETMKVIILNGINGKVIKEYNEDYPSDE